MILFGVFRAAAFALQWEGEDVPPDLYDQAVMVPEPSFSFGQVVLWFVLGLAAQVLFGFWGKSKAEENGVNPWVGFAAGFFFAYLGVRLIPILKPSWWQPVQGPRRRVGPPANAPLMHPQAAYPPQAPYPQQAPYPVPQQPGFAPVAQPQPYPPAQAPMAPAPAAYPPMAQPPVQAHTVRLDAEGYFPCPACGAKAKAGRKTCMACGAQLPRF